MDRKTCFVIAPIGSSKSRTRERSDKVLRSVIRPAVEECGYIAIRADEIAQPGIIAHQVIEKIVDSPLVIADLTERNPNVFYELALRHWLRKPLVQLIEEGEPLPFDVAGMRTITFDHRDVESIDRARKLIVEQIHSLESNKAAMVTPTSFLQDPTTKKKLPEPGTWHNAFNLSWLLIGFLVIVIIGMTTSVLKRQTRIESELGELKANASRSQILEGWVSCQEKEKLTGKSYRYNWATLECIEVP